MRKIIILSIILILFSTLVYAETCDKSYIENGLRKALYKFFTSNLTDMTISELKNLADFYKSLPDSDTVDCTGYKNEIDKAALISISIPTCSDGTQYGKCSSTMPLYCFAGRLVERCRHCGCPDGDSCDETYTSVLPWNYGQWGKCYPIPQNEICTDSDNGKDYSVQGTTVGANGIAWTDHCDPNIPGNVVESYCNGVNTNFISYNCTDGCLDGVCISQVNITKPDLIVSDIKFTPANPTTEDYTSVGIIIKNTGSGTAYNFSTKLIKDGVTVISTRTTGGLVINFEYETGGLGGYLYSAGTHTFKVVVDEFNEVSEFDETNNEFTKVLNVSCTDSDSDGFTDFLCGGNDCNDNNPNIFPGASESCDGIDTDCNGQLDNNIGNECGSGICGGSCLGNSGCGNYPASGTSAGTCKTCDGQGGITYSIVNTNPSNVCGTGTCGGTCNGAGSCQYPSTNVKVGACTSCNGAGGTTYVSSGQDTFSDCSSYTSKNLATYDPSIPGWIPWNCGSCNGAGGCNYQDNGYRVDKCVTCDGSGGSVYTPANTDPYGDCYNSACTGTGSCISQVTGTTKFYHNGKYKLITNSNVANTPISCSFMSGCVGTINLMSFNNAKNFCANVYDPEGDGVSDNWRMCEISGPPRYSDEYVAACQAKGSWSGWGMPIDGFWVGGPRAPNYYGRNVMTGSSYCVDGPYSGNYDVQMVLCCKEY